MNRAARDQLEVILLAIGLALFTWSLIAEDWLGSLVVAYITLAGAYRAD